MKAALGPALKQPNLQMAKMRIVWLCIMLQQWCELWLKRKKLKKTPCYEVTIKRSYTTPTDIRYRAEPFKSYVMPTVMKRKLEVK
jgi:hypothetical protein